MLVTQLVQDNPGSETKSLGQRVSQHNKGYRSSFDANTKYYEYFHQTTVDEPFPREKKIEYECNVISIMPSCNGRETLGLGFMKPT